MNTNELTAALSKLCIRARRVEVSYYDQCGPRSPLKRQRRLRMMLQAELDRIEAKLDDIVHPAIGTEHGDLANVVRTLCYLLHRNRTTRIVIHERDDGDDWKTRRA